MENNQNVTDFSLDTPYISLEDDEAKSDKTDKQEQSTKSKEQRTKDDSSEEKVKGTFLPADKYDKIRAKKMKGLLKSPYKPKKHQKLRKGLKIASFVALVALAGIFTYNTIKANFYNDIPPTKDPYTSDNIFDANDNDYDIGDDGQIILDTMDETEKKVLKNSFGELIFNDAQSRCSSKIGNIKNILSISLLPYNLDDKTNEFDKYYLSILFNDEHDTYCLNYLTGTDFISDAEYTKDFFIDFINFLGFECALDSCERMNDDSLKIQNLFDDVTFVGEAYKGYKENGDRYYFIPVYNNGGEGKAYYAWASPIDAYEQNPMQVLYDELSTAPQESTFDYMAFTPSENLQKVFEVLKTLQVASNESENVTTPKSSNATPKSEPTFKKYDISQEDDKII